MYVHLFFCKGWGILKIFWGKEGCIWWIKISFLQKGFIKCVFDSWVMKMRTPKGNQTFPYSLTFAMLVFLFVLTTDKSFSAGSGFTACLTVIFFFFNSSKIGCKLYYITQKYCWVAAKACFGATFRTFIAFVQTPSWWCWTN